MGKIGEEMMGAVLGVFRKHADGILAEADDPHDRLGAEIILEMCMVPEVAIAVASVDAEPLQRAADAVVELLRKRVPELE